MQADQRGLRVGRVQQIKNMCLPDARCGSVDDGARQRIELLPAFVALPAQHSIGRAGGSLRSDEDSEGLRDQRGHRTDRRLATCAGTPLGASRSQVELVELQLVVRVDAREEQVRAIDSNTRGLEPSRWCWERLR